MEYHQAEVERVSDGWQAVCKCGFAGHVRDNYDAADEDAGAHDMTGNPA